MDLLFVMDPIARINVQGDSTFVMMLEAQQRGHAVWYAELSDLELDKGRPFARARRAEVRREPGNHASLGPVERVCLDDLHAVFMRKDPPVDVEFLMACQLLDRTDRTKVVMINDPRSLTFSNEKLYAQSFADLGPDTLIARDPERIRAYVAEQKDVVVKPLDGAGGAGVVRLVHGDKNTRSIIELLTREGRVYIAAQAYLPNVVEGDRRVLLIDGVARGVINRRPSKDDLRSNMHVGGKAEPSELTARDHQIAARIGPSLKERGLVFVGIDVIDGSLTEINVTSPTGLQELARFTGLHLEKELIDYVEKKSRELRG
jgi:glutathione synthase